MPIWVVVVHLIAAASLAGIGWLTQLALYPLFDLVDEASWPDYHAAHATALSRAVAAPWAVQGVTTVALLVRPPAGVPTWAVWLDGALAAVPVLVTARWAVPLHRRLADGPGPDLLRALLRVNLLRTLIWSTACATGAGMVLLTATAGSP